MKIYLAGPMTGIPQSNFPAFDIAAMELREKGYEIISPAELDEPAERQRALASKDGIITMRQWQEFLARDLKIVSEVDGVAVLGGWHNSKGARQEVFTAVNLDKPIYRVVDTWCGFDLEGPMEAEYIWLGLRRVKS